jgi:hypothetical protein
MRMGRAARVLGIGTVGLALIVGGLAYAARVGSFLRSALR